MKLKKLKIDLKSKNQENNRLKKLVAKSSIESLQKELEITKKLLDKASKRKWYQFIKID